MENKKPKFKSDKFRKARGGHSRWLQLSCEKCKDKLFMYQKDGPGILKRLYLDRIVGKARTSCEKCKTIIAVRTIYKKENRLALRLFAGAIGKKIISIDKVKKFMEQNLIPNIWLR